MWPFSSTKKEDSVTRHSVKHHAASVHKKHEAHEESMKKEVSKKETHTTKNDKKHVEVKKKGAVHAHQDEEKKKSVAPVQQVIWKSAGKKFNSQKDVDQYYQKQREKIVDFVDQLEREKAQGYLNVVRAQVAQVREKKGKIDGMQKDLATHVNDIEKRILLIHQQKEHEKESKIAVTLLKQKLGPLDAQNAKLIIAHKALAEKEKKLMQEIVTLTEQNKKALLKTDPRGGQAFSDREMMKAELVAAARDLLSKEDAMVFSDIRILDRIDESAQKRMKKMNMQLTTLHEEKKKILQQKDLLAVSESHAAAEVARAEKRVAIVERKYRKVLATLTPK